MATNILAKNQSSVGLFCFMVLLLLQSHVSSARKLLPDPPVTHNASKHSCKFVKVFQLGDSLADTGNLVTESPRGGGALFNHFPYGITLGTSTGRCSNGLLMIDYFASEFGVPFLSPYERVEDGANFDRGVNFAVAGATALPLETLRAKNFPLGYIPTGSSLGVQLQWLSSHLNYTCQSRGEECQEELKNSLFLVGEIGGNDYNYGIVGNKSMAELYGLIPEVVQTIVDAVKAVIGLGATRVVVPGNFPIGCLPVYRDNPIDGSGGYDSNQCLAGLNRLAIAHNEVLKEAIEQLKEEYPNTAIVYADYYNAFLSVLTNAENLGFADKFSPCCGKAEARNPSAFCGAPGVTSSCPNPDDHISWDGVHMTQQAYKFMADYLITSISPQLNCS
ncbi:OLC1v1030039C1 [Oldenlandia corymbosa var. corymbosa]|uniref:OLC1v1030039C1 n=1 Tax=Oldenlandia corymbosa var. corymbosa TaxID=529605 RepID=A0AAV1CF94_OLDCO|nr:OLC1v1030039C1 [Oldenlandia corymbosa var. corymbosa]